MARALTLMMLAMTLTATVTEAHVKRIQVRAQVLQQTFTGDLGNPQLGDRLLSSVVLLNEDNEEVGTGTGVCTIATIAPLPTRLQCVLTATFASGEIIFGGAAPLPTVGIAATFGILGGTDDFRKARGEATLTVVSPTLQDAVFDLH